VTTKSPDLVKIASDIVAAFVSNNSLRTVELPGLIESVHQGLVRLSEPTPEEAPAAPKPAIAVKKSVTPDYIVSLEDGRKFKTMKRYLSGLGMTPDEYRQKWGLPKDYPMVAPNYAAKRSELAKQIGLGERRQEAVAAAKPAKKAPARTPRAKKPAPTE
jgi:predicted transcriptional regulator